MASFIDKVKDFVEKNQKEVIIGGSVVAVSTLLLLILKKGGKTPQEPVQTQKLPDYIEQEDEPQEKQKHSKRQHGKPQNNANNNESDVTQSQIQPKKSKEELIQEIVQKIDIMYIGKSDILDMSTISTVLDQSVEVAEEEYIKLTLENRKNRREVMRKDPTEYEQLLMEYNEKVEQVLLKAQEEILDAIKIEKDVFEASVLGLMERGLYKQVYMLQAAIRQKIKEKLPASRQVSIDKTKEVIQFQVKVLRDNPEFFKNIINKLQTNMDTANMIPMALNIMLQDLIFEEFQIEEEDQMKNMIGKDIMNDPDVHDFLLQIEEAMFSIIGSMQTGGDGGMGYGGLLSEQV